MSNVAIFCAYDGKMAYMREQRNNRKIENAVKAERHTKLMQDKYKDQIQASISATKLYKVVWNSKDPDENAEQNKMRIFVEDLDSVAAILKYQGSKTAVLNFASYRSPGGGFIRGSIAQEECLCHESFLYNVLESFQREFYEWNMQHKQKGLYLNRALYSPEIGFFRNVKEAFCDVITCAAPNKAAAQKYENVSDRENTEALKSRIQFVLDIAEKNEVKTLILGAYGCGVFGQDAKEVAGIFKEFLTTTHTSFDTVVFAVPDGKNGNYRRFAEVFKEN